ncbi:unnamed protein product [Gongylonema pulchrum]|uniref:Uncharacterized protein n=1 Tax=Gongylonema pulchrum TaxID=637853 RepID=A0A183EBA9_9BILA|nr:unnamed protein product [Gongylonema pulchrum]
MEIKKPALRTAAGLLECCSGLTTYGSSYQTNGNQVAIKTDTTENDDSESDRSADKIIDNDKRNDNNDERYKSRGMLSLAKKEGDDVDAKPPSVDSAGKQAERMVQAIPDLDCPELPSFQHRFSPSAHKIQQRNHEFFTCRLLHNSSDSGVNSASDTSFQEEARDTTSGSSQEIHENSGLTSFTRCFNQRPELVVPTATVIPNPDFTGFTSEFNDQESVSADTCDCDVSASFEKNDSNNYDTTLSEKRPRIERPRAHYPNSARRTSAPACLWSATSLLTVSFASLQPNQVSSPLLDNLTLLHKLLAKQQIIHENVATMNNESCSGIHDVDTAAPMLEAPPVPTIPTFSAAAPPPQPVSSWEWLRGQSFKES